MQMAQHTGFAFCAKLNHHHHPRMLSTTPNPLLLPSQLHSEKQKGSEKNQSTGQVLTIPEHGDR